MANLQSEGLRDLEKRLFEKQQLQAELEYLCEQHSGVIDIPQLSVHVLEAKAQGKPTGRKFIRLLVEGLQLDTRQRQVEGYRSLVVWNESFLVPLKNIRSVLTVQLLSKEDCVLKVQGNLTINLKAYADQVRQELWHSIGPVHLRLAIRVLHSRAVFYAQALKKVLQSITHIERLISKVRSEPLVDLKIAKLEQELQADALDVFDAELVWQDWLKDKVGERLMKRVMIKKLTVLIAQKCIKVGLEALTNRRSSIFKSKALSRLSQYRQGKQDLSSQSLAHPSSLEESTTLAPKSLHLRQSPLKLQEPQGKTEALTYLPDIAPKSPQGLPDTLLSISKAKTEVHHSPVLVARRSSIAPSSDSDVFYDAHSSSSSEPSESGVQYIEDTPYAQYSRRGRP